MTAGGKTSKAALATERPRKRHLGAVHEEEHADQSDGACGTVLEG
eukprot:SAG22_NODE_11584_length_478_cov_0.817942_2_plen_44_part_01